MARLLAYNSPATGHIFPCTGCCSSSSDAVTRSTSAPACRGRTTSVNSASRGSVDPAIEAIEFDDWQGRTQLPALERLQRTLVARGELEIPDLRTAIAEVEPDALIIDAVCEGAGAVAEASGLPWAYSAPSHLLPIQGRASVRPGPAPGSAARSAASATSARWRVPRPVVNKHLPPINALRARLGASR